MLTRSIFAICAATGVAFADIPQMGGPMSHLLVSIFDQQVYVTFESPALSTVELLASDSYFSGAASVLNETGHNAQFGWLASGFVSLPPNSGVFIRRLSGSRHLSVYSEFGFDPILGTDGSDSVWQWDGTMTHNWYSSRIGGTHTESYEVFVGDLSGNPLNGWAGGMIDLSFVYDPSPFDLGDELNHLGSQVVGSVPAPGTFLVLIGMAGTCSRRYRSC